MNVTFSARAVLLDMDGTLVDSSAAVARAWTAWAGTHGLDPAAVLSVVHGRQSYETMTILLPDRDEEAHRADNRRMIEHEIADTSGIVAIRGAEALLAALAAKPHALVTSATRDLARARMTAAGLSMPGLAVAAEDVFASKPDPEGFLLAASKLGVDARDCVVFEDSAAGIAAARNADMRVVGVGREASNHDPDWAVTDLGCVRVDPERPGVLAFTLTAGRI